MGRSHPALQKWGLGRRDSTLVSCCPSPGESAVPGVLGLVLILCESAGGVTQKAPELREKPSVAVGSSLGWWDCSQSLALVLLLC